LAQSVKIMANFRHETPSWLTHVFIVNSLTLKMEAVFCSEMSKVINDDDDDDNNNNNNNNTVP
jgi:hypothetical protein